ncbi:NAD+ dependent glucose-6-phosphate dehydrogenase [Balamuthia mandrillaris]
MMEQPTKVGVTGANGRIGRVLMDALAACPLFEWRLFSYELIPGTAPETIEAAKQEQQQQRREYIHVDLSDEEQVKGKFEGLDVVLHLAAWSEATPDLEDSTWKPILNNNIQATFNILRECVRAKVKRVVFASTNHTQNGATVKNPFSPEGLDPVKVKQVCFGESEGEAEEAAKKKKKQGMQIEDVPFPDSLYAVSKLFGEDLGKLFALQYGLEFVALRIGWIRLNDDPSDTRGTSAEEYMRAMYLSHRDAVGFFEKALTAPIQPLTPGIPFMMCYACSNNGRKIWDMQPSIHRLGYAPLDDAEQFFS